MHSSIVAVLGCLLFGMAIQTLQADQDFVQYKADLDADMAAANLEPGSLDEAILYGRLLIKLGNRINADWVQEMNQIFAEMPGRAKRTLRKYQSRLDIGIQRVAQQFRDLWLHKQQIHDKSTQFIGPLMQRLAEMLTTASGDIHLAARLAQAFATTGPEVQACMDRGAARNKRLVDNFLNVALRTLRHGDESLDVYVALARFGVLELQGALDDHEAEVKIVHDGIDNQVAVELDALEANER